jgi:hypothetical protein
MVSPTRTRWLSLKSEALVLLRDHKPLARILIVEVVSQDLSRMASLGVGDCVDCDSQHSCRTEAMKL